MEIVRRSLKDRENYHGHVIDTFNGRVRVKSLSLYIYISVETLLKRETVIIFTAIR